MDGYNFSTRRDLYSCQLFGFTPRAFVDFFHNMLSREISDALTEIENQIKKEGSENLRNMCDKNLGKNVDRLELYLQSNIFTIPDNVILSEDKIQEQETNTKEFEESLDKRIDELKNKIKASFNSRWQMQKQLKEMDNLEEQALQLLQRTNNYSNEHEILNSDYMKTLCQNGRLFVDSMNSEISSMTSSPKDESQNEECAPVKTKKARKSRKSR
eukprot:gene10807-11961_t